MAGSDAGGVPVGAAGDTAAGVAPGADGPSGGGSDLAGRARTLLADLASSPRPAGSAAEARARASCAEWLTAHGFAVAERRFGYSALPGRWGTPAAGVVSVVSLGAVLVAGAAGRYLAASALVVGTALVLVLAGRWGARRGVLSLPVMRRQSVNLLATRGVRPPVVWLTAHLDSKSQPVPIALRAAGVMGTLASWGVAGALLVAGVAGADAPAPVWWAVLAAGAFCAVPIVASTVGERSDGALDNASGVAAVLAAAALLARDPEARVGIAITSAEELGLAGARAWAAGMGPAIALNCDGVDDGGETVAMYSGRPPAMLLEALADAGASAGGVRARRLVPGILTDHVALADAGWATVTVSRGGVATLRRIHTRADSLARLRGDGLMPVAALLAGAATRLARPAREPGAGSRGGVGGGS